MSIRIALLVSAGIVVITIDLNAHAQTLRATVSFGANISVIAERAIGNVLTRFSLGITEIICAWVVIGAVPVAAPRAHPLKTLLTNRAGISIVTRGALFYGRQHTHAFILCTHHLFAGTRLPIEDPAEILVYTGNLHHVWPTLLAIRCIGIHRPCIRRVMNGYGTAAGHGPQKEKRACPGNETKHQCRSAAEEIGGIMA